MKATCEMVKRPWASDQACEQPAVGTHEHTVRVCAECAAGLQCEGFEIVFDGSNKEPSS